MDESAKSLQIKTYTINHKKWFNTLNIKVNVIKNIQSNNIWQSLDHIWVI